MKKTRTLAVFLLLGTLLLCAFGAAGAAGNGIAVIDEKITDDSLEYTISIEEGLNGTAVLSIFDEDHQLKNVKTQKTDGKGSIILRSEKTITKGTAVVMLWDSVQGMKPLADQIQKEIGTGHTAKPTVIPTAGPEQTPQPETESVTLNKKTYPLVVGNASKTDFSDWETRGSTVTLRATVNDSDYTYRDITWKSQDLSIANIISTGGSGMEATAKIQGRTTGTATIYAFLPNGETTTATVTVIDNVTRLTVMTLGFNTGELTLSKGKEAALTPIIYPKDVFGNGVLNQEVIWSSSDENVATVKDGKVVAIHEGTSTIKAVSKDIGREAICQVTVVSASDVSGIQLAQAASVQNIKVGEQLKLTANAIGGESEIVWRSENSYIADVDPNGIVTAYSNSNVPRVGANGQIVFEDGKVVYDKGIVHIFATTKDGGYVGTYEISVEDREAKAQAVKMNKQALNLAKGTQKTVTAAVLPATQFEKNVSWSSSDPNIATVAGSGRTVYGVCKADITAVSEGTAVITAQCDGKKDICTVTVTNGVVNVSSIRITNTKELEAEEVYPLEAELTVDAANPETGWLSTDRETVTVNNEGILKAYKAGTVKIYAVAMDSVKDMDQFEALADTRTIGANNEKLADFLKDAVYAETEITVRNSSPYLRNLNVPEEAVTDHSVNLLWNRASLIDAGDWKSYEVYCGQEKLANVTTLGFTAKNLKPDTTYKFEVRAVDGNGNVLERQAIAATTKVQSQKINVLDYGAKGNGKVMDTYAIQNAVDACPEGGTVVLPKGYVFYSGALFLKSNMTFQVDGILMGSPEDKDYPLIITRWEGWRKLYQPAEEWANTTSALPENHYAHASLINAGTYDEGQNSHTGPYNIENLVICGEGQINGNGFRVGYNEGLNQKTGAGGWPEPMTPAMDQTIRGRAITFHNAQNVYVKDVTVAYGPAWTVHAIYCDKVTFDGLEVIAKGDGKTGAADDICILNGDGIDPDSSTNVNVFNVQFCAGDDAIAMKSGRNKEGNDLDKPNAYVRITDCVSDGSKGGFCIGSENASGVRDTLFQNLSVKNIKLSHSIWLKTYWSRGGVSQDIHFRDIDSNYRIDIAANYETGFNNPADELPQYRYMTFENCTPPFVFEGLKAESGRPATYVQNMTVRGCKGSGKLSYCKDFSIWDVDESKWSIDNNSSGIQFLRTGQFEDVDIKLKGEPRFVRGIDLDAKIISVLADTACGSAVDEIDSVINTGTQLYTFYDGSEKQLSDTDVLMDGYKLLVTAQDGEHTAEYTVSTVVSEEPYEDTKLVVSEGAIHVTGIKENRIKVKDSTTVENMLSEINSSWGLKQAYEVRRSGAALSGSEVLEAGDIVTVTAPNGNKTEDYTVELAAVLSWDFREIFAAKTTMDTLENNTCSYNGMTIRGGGSSDYIDTSVGLHVNGKTTSANRYIAYTPTENGTLEITARRSFSNGKLYCTEAASITGGSVVPNLSNNADWKTGAVEVAAGTTYYFYFVDSGMQVQQMQFVGN